MMVMGQNGDYISVKWRRSDWYNDVETFSPSPQTHKASHENSFFISSRYACEYMEIVHLYTALTR